MTQPILHVLLGANGDICAMLPFLKAEADAYGKQVRLMIAKEFAPILDGVSYVKPVIWNGTFHQLPQALAFLREDVPEVRVKALQIYGNPGAGCKCPSFVPDMWRLAGRPNEWDAHPLVFDRRDAKREQALIESVDDGRPMILVAGQGKSSPFLFHVELLSSIRAAFCKTHNVVDLSTVRAHRVYDLLGLYDKAEALVSIDTMHLHLSRASKVPVIALTANDPEGWKGPMNWHASPPYRNQVFRLNYTDYEKRPMEVVQAVAAAIHSVPSNWTVPEDRILHVTSARPRDDGAQRRHTTAARTWYFDVPHDDQTCFASGHQSVKAMIEEAISEHGGYDIIVLSNDDTNMVDGITSQILRACNIAGSGYAHRWDSNVPIVCPILPHEIRKLTWYGGCDLFCFTVAWWNQFKDDFPDMLIGCESWDRIMRELIKSTGGSELIEAIYHERHESKWEVERMTHKGNIHNRILARKWLRERGMPLAELDFEESPPL